MKRLSLLALLLLALRSEAATVIGNLHDGVFGSAVTGSLIFTPQLTPLGVGNATYLDGSRKVITAADGTWTANNLVGGLYLVGLFPQSRQILIFVPLNDSSTYQFNQVANINLVIGITSLSGTNVDIVPGIGVSFSTNGHQVTIAAENLVPGLNVVFVTNNMGQIVISASTTNATTTNVFIFPTSQPAGIVTTNLLGSVYGIGTNVIFTTNFEAIVVQANGLVVGPNGAVSTAGTTTSGIEEALKALPVNGGEVYIGPGTHNITTPIVIPIPIPPVTNYSVKIRGAGRLNTFVNYVGTVVTNAIICSTNLPRANVIVPLEFEMEDIAVTYASNFNATILGLGSLQQVTLRRCGFGHTFTYQTISTNAFFPTNALSLMGVDLRLGQGYSALISDCVFYGLANGIHASMDHVTIKHTVGDRIGRYWDGASWVAGTGIGTGALSLGALVVDDSPFDDVYLDDVYGFLCNVAIVDTVVNLTSHLRTHGLTLEDCKHRVVGYDQRLAAIVCDSTLKVSGGFDDVVITNGPNQTVGISDFPLHRIIDITTDYKNGGQIHFASGSNDMFSISPVLGNTTNASRFSILHDQAVFDETQVQATNFWYFGGSDSNSLNGKYIRTNVVVGLDSAGIELTNVVSGAYVIYDPNFSFNVVDVWEVYGRDHVAILSSGTFDSKFPSTVSSFGMIGAPTTAQASWTSFYASTTNQYSAGNLALFGPSSSTNLFSAGPYNPQGEQAFRISAETGTGPRGDSGNVYIANKLQVNYQIQVTTNFTVGPNGTAATLWRAGGRIYLRALPSAQPGVVMSGGTNVVSLIGSDGSFHINDGFNYNPNPLLSDDWLAFRPDGSAYFAGDGTGSGVFLASISAAGVVTGSSFVGSGTSLTGIPTLAGNNTFSGINTFSTALITSLTSTTLTNTGNVGIKGTLYATTNTASFSLDTPTIALNTWYTNYAQRAHFLFVISYQETATVAVDTEVLVEQIPTTAQSWDYGAPLSQAALTGLTPGLSTNTISIPIGNGARYCVTNRTSAGPTVNLVRVHRLGI